MIQCATENTVGTPYNTNVWVKKISDHALWKPIDCASYLLDSSKSSDQISHGGSFPVAQLMAQCTHNPAALGNYSSSEQSTVTLSPTLTPMDGKRYLEPQILVTYDSRQLLMAKRPATRDWPEQISPLVHSSSTAWQLFNLSQSLEMHFPHLLGLVGQLHTKCISHIWLCTYIAKTIPP